MLAISNADPTIGDLGHLPSPTVTLMTSLKEKENSVPYSQSPSLRVNPLILGGSLYAQSPDVPLMLCRKWETVLVFFVVLRFGVLHLNTTSVGSPAHDSFPLVTLRHHDSK